MNFVAHRPMEGITGTDLLPEMVDYAEETDGLSLNQPSFDPANPVYLIETPPRNGLPSDEIDTEYQHVDPAQILWTTTTYDEDSDPGEEAEEEDYEEEDGDDEEEDYDAEEEEYEEDYEEEDEQEDPEDGEAEQVQPSGESQQARMQAPMSRRRSRGAPSWEPVAQQPP